MYVPIIASGPNGAILHYGHAGAPNGRQERGGRGDWLVLPVIALDMCLCALGHGVPLNGTGVNRRAAKELN